MIGANVKFIANRTSTIFHVCIIIIIINNGFSLSVRCTNHTQTRPKKEHINLALSSFLLDAFDNALHSVFANVYWKNLNKWAKDFMHTSDRAKHWLNMIHNSADNYCTICWQSHKKFLFRHRAAFSPRQPSSFCFFYVYVICEPFPPLLIYFNFNWISPAN